MTGHAAPVFDRRRPSTSASQYRVMTTLTPALFPSLYGVDRRNSRPKLYRIWASRVTWGQECLGELESQHPPGTDRDGSHAEALQGFTDWLNRRDRISDQLSKVASPLPSKRWPSHCATRPKATPMAEVLG